MLPAGLPCSGFRCHGSACLRFIAAQGTVKLGRRGLAKKLPLRGQLWHVRLCGISCWAPIAEDGKGCAVGLLGGRNLELQVSKQQCWGDTSRLSMFSTSRAVDTHCRCRHICNGCV